MATQISVHVHCPRSDCNTPQAVLMLIKSGTERVHTSAAYAILVEMDPLVSTCLNVHPVWDAPNAYLFSFPFPSNRLNGHDADVLIATFDESVPHVPSEWMVLLFRLTST